MILSPLLFSLLMSHCHLSDSSVLQGGFVGAMVAMSSTSIVVKVLSENRTSNTPAGQITIGTLILQVCVHSCIRWKGIGDARPWCRGVIVLICDACVFV